MARRGLSPSGSAGTEVISESLPNAQIGFPVSAADEMQNERHHSYDKENMNQPARYMKKNPARKPGNYQNQKHYHEDGHRTSRTARKGRMT
jgi:hypothetical protein